MNLSARWIFGLCVATSLLLVAGALGFWGAAEIRANATEIFLLTLIGGVWLSVAPRLFSWLGLSFRDDAVERKNIAALIALCGAEIAAAIIYAGGSVGEGPSYSNNVFSTALAAVGLFGLWTMLEIGGEVSISIAEERDLASGIRLCGFLLAVGLILGRAVAGDWHSESATIRDFITDGWPAIVICALALGSEPFIRPGQRNPFPSWPKWGLIPALIYLTIACAWVFHVGAWEGMAK
jgi:hypothetical protein